MKKIASFAVIAIVSAATMLGFVELGRADTPVVQIAQASGAPAADPRGTVTIPPFEAPAGEPATETSTATTAADKPSDKPSAPTVPDPETDAAGFFKALLDAATTGKWKVLAGLVLVGLVYATRRWVFGKVSWFQTKLGGVVLALGLSLAGTFGLALASGSAVTMAVLLNALSTAVAAAGLWQWLQSAKAPKA